MLAPSFHSFGDLSPSSKPGLTNMFLAAAPAGDSLSLVAASGLADAGAGSAGADRGSDQSSAAADNRTVAIGSFVRDMGFSVDD
jgi:hypothetical protein